MVKVKGEAPNHNPIDTMCSIDKGHFLRLLPAQKAFVAELLDLLNEYSVSPAALLLLTGLLSRLPLSCRSSGDFLSFIKQLQQEATNSFSWPEGMEHDTSQAVSENHVTQRETRNAG